MSYKISKELFETVISNWTEGEQLYHIHVDTFFFKCKEWALRQGYILHSSIDEMGKGYLKVDEFNEEMYGQSIKTFTEDFEQQTVFDTCQWILDIKDNND